MLHDSSYPPIFGMQDNGSGVFKAVAIIGINTVLSQFLHKTPIQFTHFDTIQEAVHPVELPGYPVHSEALAMQHSVDHNLSVAAIKGHPFYHSTAHVDPVKTLVHAIKVHGHHAGQALQDQRIGLPVSRQVPQVIAVAEDEVGCDVAVLAAAASVWLSEESWGALAHVGADSVLAHLAAHARRLGTLVNIVTGFVVGHEAVARTTGTYETGECVGAVVITVVDGGVCAFIDTYS